MSAFQEVWCDFHPQNQSGVVCERCNKNLCGIDMQIVDGMKQETMDFPIKRETLTCVQCFSENAIESFKNSQTGAVKDVFGAFIFFVILFLSALGILFSGGGTDEWIAFTFVSLFSLLPLGVALQSYNGYKKDKAYKEPIYRFFSNIQFPIAQSRTEFRDHEIERKIYKSTQNVTQQNLSNRPKFAVPIQTSKLDFEETDRSESHLFSFYFGALIIYCIFAGLSLFYLFSQDNFFLSDLVINEYFKKIASRTLGDLFNNSNQVFLLFSLLVSLIAMIGCLIMPYLSKLEDYGTVVLFLSLQASINYIFRNQISTHFSDTNIVIYNLIPMVILLFYYTTIQKRNAEMRPFTGVSLAILRDYPSMILVNFLIVVLSSVFQIMSYSLLIQAYRFVQPLNNFQLEFTIALICEFIFIYLQVITINLFSTFMIEYIIHWFKGEKPSIKQILFNVKTMFGFLAKYSIFSTIIKFLSGSNEPNEKFSLWNLVKLPKTILELFTNLILPKIWSYLDFYTLVNLSLHKSKQYSLKECVEKTAIIKWYGMIELINIKEQKNLLKLLLNASAILIVFFYLVLDIFQIPHTFKISGFRDFMQFVVLAVLFLYFPLLISYSLISRLNNAFVFLYSDSIVRREQRPEPFPAELDNYLNNKFPALFNYREFGQDERKMKDPFKELKVTTQLENI